MVSDTFKVSDTSSAVRQRTRNTRATAVALVAVRAYATEGEIMQAMIEVFGTYTETAVV